MGHFEAIVAFSEQCEVKLVHGVLLLYLVPYNGTIWRYIGDLADHQNN